MRCMHCWCPGLHTSDYYLVADRALLCPLQAALVVYDGVHYLRDRERGVVWEESIALMPKFTHIRLWLSRSSPAVSSPGGAGGL